ncbi:MAG: nucleotide exchange factor GrpE [Armatimonadetes bacterium]|jgi:molecular chaperone GrpE|nr:nucleotide exchange factor GrpE [Armatimonadota bacterium]
MSEEKQPAESGAPAEAVTPQGTEPPEPGEALARLEARVSELSAALEEKSQQAEAWEKEAREYLDGLQRERASFENYRRRVIREMNEAGTLAKADLIARLLPAIDNLERALSDATEDADVVRKGVRMIYEQLMTTLQQQGLQEVPAEGQPFDPNRHEAVDAVAGTGAEPDTVVEQLLKGYTFGDRLVRAARVRVAR